MGGAAANSAGADTASGGAGDGAGDGAKSAAAAAGGAEGTGARRQARQIPQSQGSETPAAPGDGSGGCRSSGGPHNEPVPKRASRGKK